MVGMCGTLVVQVRYTAVEAVSCDLALQFALKNVTTWYSYHNLLRYR